jgi:hypothetical protein
VKTIFVYLAFTSPLLFAAALCAETPTPPSHPAAAPNNFPTTTLGGTQFWTDELVYGKWRIQQNVLSGHYRLLDDRDFRRAWGTFEQCQAKLDELKIAENLAAPEGKVVVTLHGLTRSRDAMEGMGGYLEKEAGYTWVNVGYASTRRTLDEHAHSLARVVSGLERAEEIHFVCHSLGNLVVRRYLGEASAPEPKWQPDRRIKRMVMLGPPNNGAQMARHFKNNKLFGLLIGPSGKQLASTWEETQKQLVTPSFEFGIVAGGQESDGGPNPLVDGDDDFIVSVAETRLAGAHDFLLVPCWHGSMMDDAQVRRCTRRFLDEGCFLAPDKRSPVVETAATPAGAVPGSSAAQR